MKFYLQLFSFLLLGNFAISQQVYTIKADSVKITNCDSSELILENHTQAVKGFLYNTGNGRTVFKKGVVKLNDSFFLIGADTLKVPSTSWLQGGNAFGATGVLGTLDNHHLDLYSNGIQRARLTSTGNLLLGTTTDGGQTLQVNGDVNFNNANGASIETFPSSIGISASGALYLGTPVIRALYGSNVDSFYLYASYAQAQFGNLAASGSYQFSIFGGSSYLQVHPLEDGSGETDINNLGTGSNPVLKIVSPTRFFCPGNVGNGFVFFTENTAAKVFEIADSVGRDNFLVNGTGNVLINKDPSLGAFYGDNDDGNSLQVRGISQAGSSANGAVSITQGWNTTGSPTAFKLNVFDTAAGSTAALMDLQLSGTSYFTFKANGGVRFAGLTNDSTQTRVLVSDASGNLYYRSASSLAMNGLLPSSLAINGELTAKKLRLKPTGWADYVFASGYQLPSLPELERYIQKHNHLPGIPSAGEVEQKGVDVGETQKALLQKIEELTLYSIEQDKKLAAQQRELESLRGYVDDLKKLITTKLNK